jgi:hypothetical protein
MVEMVQEGVKIGKPFKDILRLAESKLEIVEHHTTVTVTPAQRLAAYRQERLALAVEPVIQDLLTVPEKPTPKNPVGQKSAVQKPSTPTFDLGF